jgi:MoaA/NifB/PqqE/SkfB family radical SAM enzyme
MIRWTNRHKLFAHLARMDGWRRGKCPAPVTVEYDLSNRCPVHCEWCAFAALRTNRPETAETATCGDLADPDVVMRALGEMADAGVRGVVWSGGGDPLMHPQWTEIVGYAGSVGFQQGMYTSGVMLTPFTADRLAEALIWVVVSLDALTADHYATAKGSNTTCFTAACRTIRRMADKTTVGVSFLLHAGTWRQAPAMRDLARFLGATYSVFRPMILPDSPPADREWITDALPLLRELAQEADVEVDPDRFVAYRDWVGRDYLACYGIRFTTVVTPDGRVWVCCQRRGLADSCLGDLTTESFMGIWARHPGRWTDFSQCRPMCHCDGLNHVLDAVYATHPHEAFV